MLSQLAEESYARNRHSDLARATADGTRQPSAPVGRGIVPGHGRLSGSGHLPGRAPRPANLSPRWRLAATAAVAAAAAVAAVVVVAPHGTRGHAPAVASRSAPSARTFLLTSADVTARHATATGAYWYVRERDYEPTAPLSKNTSFGALYEATEESWTGPHRTRTIVGEDLTFGFASAAGQGALASRRQPEACRTGRIRQGRLRSL